MDTAGTDAFSAAGLSVTVDVDSGSGLSLGLINANPETGSLTIAGATSPGVLAFFNPQAPATPNGTETVSFVEYSPRGRGFGRVSTVSYTGFDSVVLS